MEKSEHLIPVGQAAPVLTPPQPEVSPFADTAILKIDGSLELSSSRTPESPAFNTRAESLASEAAAATPNSSPKLLKKIGNWMVRSRLRRAATGLGVVALGTGASIMEAPAAHADTVLVATVTGTGSSGLWGHDGSPTGPLDEIMPENDKFDVSCYMTGPNVAGYRAWLFGTDERTGKELVASNAYLLTGSGAGPQEFSELEAQGVEECGEESQTSTSNGDVQNYDESGYSREAAADWALQHAKDPQPYSQDDEDCTWFVSNALWAGGLAQTPEWHSGGHYGSPHIPGTGFGSGAPGTAIAWKANDLVQYLRETYPDVTYTPLDFSQNNQPEAKPGDIIAYDWEGDGVIDHLAMIVDDAPGTQYPEVAEWGNLHPGEKESSYQKTGWTYSKYYGRWIQAAYTDPHAYLLRVVVANF